MKARPHFPLLAKVLVWLLLHLLILGLAFVGFVGWQLGLGLDSLLSGAAGERLKNFGDVVKEEIQELPPPAWNDAIQNLAKPLKISAAIMDPKDSSAAPFPIPLNVIERLKTSRPPPPSPPGRRGPGPPPRADAPDEKDLVSPPPGPRDRPPLRGGAAPPTPSKRDDDFSRPLPENRPVFLMRGDGGDGYWAAVHLHLRDSPSLPPRNELLLVRADRLDGSGMFFEFKPWLWGGLAVLALSLAFWTPFVWSLTRYIRRLTAATDRIARGEFEITLPARGNDELGNLGHAIQTMAGQLGHLISGQKRFLGDAAHELCAPLARLRTGLGILEMKLSEETQPHLSSIETDTQELATLVEEILAFSRAGNRKPRYQEIALEPLLHQVLAREAGNPNTELIVPSELSLVTDPTLLARAVGNLVRNAKVHAGSSAKVTIEVTTSESHIEICVSDDGPGVAAAELPRLFEPFYRPDRSRSRDTGGSGLGLAIVKTAIEACGGTVMAFLPPSGGFSVIIRLPKKLMTSDLSRG
jgi:two-component system, OmpR family, sensor histidine kinase CpxA